MYMYHNHISCIIKTTKPSFHHYLDLKKRSTSGNTIVRTYGHFVKLGYYHIKMHIRKNVLFSVKFL